MRKRTIRHLEMHKQKLLHGRDSDDYRDRDDVVYDKCDSVHSALQDSYISMFVQSDQETRMRNGSY